MLPFASETVVLRGGVILPLAAISLALELESRGCFMTLDGTDLLVGPPDRITDEDIRAVRAYKGDLIELVRYVDREVAQ